MTKSSPSMYPISRVPVGSDSIIRYHLSFKSSLDTDFYRERMSHCAKKCTTVPHHANIWWDAMQTCTRLLL
jgi:hypothetical protein